MRSRAASASVRRIPVNAPAVSASSTDQREVRVTAAAFARPQQSSRERAGLRFPYRRCVVTVVSPHLVAVDAGWDDRPDAGAWIADRLGPFGASVGHAVPLGYPAYAVVPIPPDHDRGCLPAIEA